MSRRQDIVCLVRTISEIEVVVGRRSQAASWWEVHERWVWSPVM